MQTKIVGIEGIEYAGELLRKGEIVAIPTETVYGLAANALDKNAVPKIFTAKGRPQDNPLIVHIDSIEMWETLVLEIPDKARLLAETLWPCPLTIILKKSKLVPEITSAGLDTVAVRMPSHPIALSIIKSAGVPLAGPSANISGFPSPTKAEHCLYDLNGKIPLIVDGGTCDIGIESTVISMVDIPIILRPGAITAQVISEILGEDVKICASATSALSDNETAISPGMKYRHYSPKAKVIIVDGNLEQFNNFIKTQNEDNIYALIFTEDAKSCPCKYVIYGEQNDSLSQAKGLFNSLRMIDEIGAELVYARMPKSDGIGLGVYNRMLRAAGFEVIKL